MSCNWPTHGGTKLLVSSLELAMPYREERIPHGNVESLRVLCAEDSRDIALVMKETLKLSGHFVQCVEDGRDAMARIARTPDIFDVVITDHEMARSTGIDVVRCLRECGFPGWVIVHCSSLRASDHACYRALHVDYIFEKPRESMEMLRLVGAFRRKD